MNNKKLQSFIGKWKTYGVIEKTPMGDAGILAGYDSYKWYNNKDFVIHSVNVKMGRKKVVNSEVIAFDKSKKQFALYAFDSLATAGIQYGLLKGKKWSIDGKGIRFRGEFNRSYSELTGEWQYRVGSSWKRWMTLSLTKMA